MLLPWPCCSHSWLWASPDHPGFLVNCCVLSQDSVLPKRRGLPVSGMGCRGEQGWAGRMHCSCHCHCSSLLDTLVPDAAFKKSYIFKSLCAAAGISCLGNEIRGKTVLWLCQGAQRQLKGTRHPSSSPLSVCPSVCAAGIAKLQGPGRGFSGKAQHPQQQGELTGASLPLWAGFPISMLLAGGKSHS